MLAGETSMNKRIQELAKQAGAGEWGDSIVPAMMDVEKFAELILKECIQVAGDNACSPTETPNPNIGMAKLEVVKAIIRHFGVER